MGGGTHHAHILSRQRKEKRLCGATKGLQDHGMRLGYDFVENNDKNISREVTNLNGPSGERR